MPGLRGADWITWREIPELLLPLFLFATSMVPSQ